MLGWVGLRTGYGTRRALSVVAQRGGWVAVRAAELPNATPGWIRASAARVQPVAWSLLAELGARTLVVRDGRRVVARYRISIGAPDTPTPTGRYGVTDRLLVAPGGPYGYGILALSGHQPHLPTGWSGGDRLAVHGTPDESTIGDADTNGCLHASTAAMKALLREIPIGTTLTVRR
jgi:lipoprotein-anchoring transpeptidase ErfK/SrfK